VLIECIERGEEPVAAIEVVGPKVAGTHASAPTMS
jgi:hypothetical protein